MHKTGPRLFDRIHNCAGTEVYAVESYGFDSRDRAPFVAARRERAPRRLRTFLLRDLSPVAGVDHTWVEVSA